MHKLALFAPFLFLLSACSEQPAYPQRQIPPTLLDDATHRAAGAQLFREHCAICHGETGEGRSQRANFFQPPAADFREPRFRTIDPAYLYWRIETGKTVEPYLSSGSVMPAWGPHLSEEQIWQLVAYLRARAG